MKIIIFLVAALISATLILWYVMRNDTETTAQPQSEAQTQAASTGESASGQTTVVATSQAPRERVIYFDFDSSALRKADRAAIEANSQFLATNPHAAISLEGHADERGSRPYNATLGEHRAQAVATALRAMGVNGQRVRVVSHGEEKPAAAGHDEVSWTRNRRVEIIYRE